MTDKKRKPRLSVEQLYAILVAAEGNQTSLIDAMKDCDPEQVAKEKALLKAARDFRLAWFGESSLEEDFRTAKRVSAYDLVNKP